MAAFSASARRASSWAGVIVVSRHRTYSRSTVLSGLLCCRRRRMASTSRHMPASWKPAESTLRELKAMSTLTLNSRGLRPAARALVTTRAGPDLYVIYVLRETAAVWDHRRRLRGYHAPHEYDPRLWLRPNAHDPSHTRCRHGEIHCTHSVRHFACFAKASHKSASERLNLLRSSCDTDSRGGLHVLPTVAESDASLTSLILLV